MQNSHRRLAAFTPYALVSTCVVLAWYVFHRVRPTPLYPLDDPYIFLHSAQVLHWGHDPNYPGVAALYGITSAPFLGLLYLLLFFVSPTSALNAACWLGVLAYALGLVYLVRSIGLSRYASLAVLVIGLCASFVPVHLLNGLETGWAMAGTVWTLALGSARRFYLASAMAGVTAAIRPDFLPFAVLIVAGLAAMMPREDRVRFVIRGLVVAAIPVTLCALWYLYQTGHPYPLTGEAKRYYMAQDHVPFRTKLEWEGGFFLVYLISCGPLLLGIWKTRRQPLTVAILAFIGLMLISLYIQFPAAVVWNQYRYVVTLTPMLVWCFAMAYKEQQERGWFVYPLLYALLFTFPIAARVYDADCHYYSDALRDTAAWCNSNLPANSTILVQDAGYIAYGTRYHIVDFVGLKTPEAIALNRRYSWPTRGAGRVDAIAALGSQEHADYLINLGERNDATKQLPSQLVQRGWRLSLMASIGLYRVYAIEPPR